MHRYFHSGLRIASEMHLPEWDVFSCDWPGDADVEIAISDGQAPAFPSDASTAVTNDTAGFAIDGIGAWELESGRRMVVFPSTAADPRMVRLFTLGSAWGLLGYQRGDAMWHGSAIEIAGHTAMFCGAAGEGKSTMAGTMIAAGAALVADDLSRIGTMGEGVCIHPSSARIKLWGEAVAHFGWQDRVIERDLVREDKFHCSVPANHARGCAMPLSAICVLETGDRLALDPLSGVHALKAVLRGTIYRPEAIEAMGRWGEQGALAAAVVAKVPVWRLTRPRDLAALADAGALVVGMLDRLG